MTKRWIRRSVPDTDIHSDGKSGSCDTDSAVYRKPDCIYRLFALHVDYAGRQNILERHFQGPAKKGQAVFKRNAGYSV